MKYKYLYIFISSTLFLIILYFGLSLAFNNTAKLLFETKLNETLQKNGLSISYQTEKFSLTKRNITLTEIKIKRDSIIVGTFSEQIYSVLIDTVALKIQTWLPLLMERSLRFSTVNIINPKIVAISVKKKPTDSVQNKKTARFKLIIRNLNIQNANIDLLKNSTLFFSVHGANLNIRKLRFNSSKSKKDIPLSYKSLSFSSDEIYFKNEVQLNEIQIGNVFLNSEKEHIILHDLKLIPTKKNYQIAAHFGYRKPYVKLNIKKLDISGVNLLDLSALSNIIHFKRLTISNIKAITYIDKRYKAKHKQAKTIQEIILGIPVKFAADTVQLLNAEIKHSERIAGNSTLSRLNIPNISTHLYYLSNDTDYLSKTPPFKLFVSGRLDKRSYFSVNATIPLLSSSCSNSLKGKLTGTDLRSLNSYIVPAAGIRFKSGLIKKMHFNIVGNNHNASCELLMEYSNLKLEILNKSKKTKSRKMLSFLTNTVVKTDNPKGRKKAKTVTSRVEIADGCVREMWINSLTEAAKETMVPIATAKRQKKKHK